MPEEDLPVLLPDAVDYRGQRREPADPRRGVPQRHVPDRAASPASARRTRWTRSSTRPGTGIRYLSPDTAGRPDRPRPGRAWTPVDQYTGGAEHAVMHLLYAREFTKMMRDLGLIDQNEPFKRLFNQGQILGADGERMSKSRGNVQDPDDLVEALRRRHGPAVPDVHGPVGPGRPVEPDRDRRRPPLPEPRLGADARAALPRAGRPGRRARCRTGRTRRPPGPRCALPPTARCAT